MKRLWLYLMICASFFAFHESAMAADYVGSDTCAGCHEGAVESYSKTVHANKAVGNSPGSGAGCESCHGAGSDHVNAGGGKGTGAFGFGKKDDAKEKSERCLSCHSSSSNLAFWSMSRHQADGVSCNNCHSPHPANGSLKPAEPEVCFGCHRDIKMQVSKQSHHPIKEGRVSCSDCHDPHGSFGSKMIVTDTVNELCYKCHAEKRGPYMWEHAPVEENCLACHSVHGSNHSKLLTSKPPLLCQICHPTNHGNRAWTGFDSSFGSLNENAVAPNNNIFKFAGRGCVNCHTHIHGSNGPALYGQFFVR